MSCTAHMIALKANEKLEDEMKRTMAWIACPTVTELLHAAERGAGAKYHLRALTDIMDGLESVMRELDLYLMKGSLSKLFVHDREYCK